MADIVDQKMRSRMMSGIRGKNTRPEVVIRQRLHARGIRFRLHRKDLPGSPDIVLPRYRAAVLVNGCFWHGHQCRLFKWPRTRPDFWSEKIIGNIRRDERKQAELKKLGWRVCILWECEIKSAGNEQILSVVDQIVEWLDSDSMVLNLPHSRTQVL